MPKKIDRLKFIEEMIARFPQVKEEILDKDYAGSINLQMGVFKRFTQESIDSNNTLLITACFDFINSAFHTVTFDVENAIIITYLGHLNFLGNKDAERLLPARLAEVTYSVKRYQNREPNEGIKQFLKSSERE